MTSLAFLLANIQLIHQHQTPSSVFCCRAPQGHTGRDVFRNWGYVPASYFLWKSLELMFPENVFSSCTQNVYVIHSQSERRLRREILPSPKTMHRWTRILKVRELDYITTVYAEKPPQNSFCEGYSLLLLCWCCFRFKDISRWWIPDFRDTSTLIPRRALQSGITPCARPHPDTAACILAE